MKKIASIRIRHEIDTDPDLSFLGEYQDSPGDDEKTIDRKERGDCGRNEFRYFVAAMSGDDTGNPASVDQDYNRAESYNRGDWWMIGIFAEAEIQTSEDGRHWTIQRIRSPGLWGIESDSDQSYIAEIEAEQKTELADILAEFGFNRRTIRAAMKSADCAVSDV